MARKNAETETETVNDTLIGSELLSAKEQMEALLKQAQEKREEFEGARRETLVDLHEKLGYENRKELIEALQKLHGPGIPSASGRSRVRLTPEERNRVKAEIRAKTKTGPEIASEFGISLPTVYNIKKEAEEEDRAAAKK